VVLQNLEFKDWHPFFKYDPKSLDVPVPLLVVEGLLVVITAMVVPVGVAVVPVKHALVNSAVP